MAPSADSNSIDYSVAHIKQSPCLLKLRTEKPTDSHGRTSKQGTFFHEEENKKKKNKFHEVMISIPFQDFKISPNLLFYKTACLNLFIITKIIFVKS